MNSRVNHATIGIVSLAGLFLFGFLGYGVNVEKVHAQRATFSPQVRASGSVPVDASPTFLATDGKQYRPFETNSAPTQNDQATRIRMQTVGAPLAASAQPVVVAIKDGPQLSGEPIGLDALQVTTIFGPVLIPLNRIAGVRNADDPRQPATICLTNGDSLTGMLTTDSMTIKTQWGSATIGRDHIVTIVTSTGQVTWQQQDGRWRIRSAEPVKTESDKADAPNQVSPFQPATADLLNLPPAIDATLVPSIEGPASRAP